MAYYWSEWLGDVNSLSVAKNKKNCVGQSRLWHRVRLQYTRDTDARKVTITEVAIQVAGKVQSRGKYPSSPPPDGTTIAEMSFKVVDTFDVYLNGTKVLDTGTLKYNWSSAKTPHTLITKSINKTYYYDDSGKISISVKLYLKKTGLRGKSTSTTGHYLSINNTVNFNGGGNIGPKITWSAPSTSGFTVQVGSYSTKPDGIFSIRCGGLSGGTGNGTTKNYQVYFTVYRDGSKIFTSDRYSVGANTFKEFRPSDFYKSRPGDNIYGHGVGLTKDANNADKQLINAVAPHPGDDVPIKVYKDGIVYCKDYNGNLHEVTMAYCKDTGGTERKLRYIPVRDNNGVEHIIDMYTTSYE